VGVAVCGAMAAAPRQDGGEHDEHDRVRGDDAIREILSATGISSDQYRRGALDASRARRNILDARRNQPMSPEDVAELRTVFAEGLEPVHRELGVMRRVLDEHTALLEGIDNRLTNVEGILDGAEILVRKKAG
jgi:hypothetical protein